MPFSPEKPFNDLPLPPPKVPIETKATLKKARFLVTAGIAGRKTAANYLKQLEKIGILQAYKVGKENLCLNKELFEILSK